MQTTFSVFITLRYVVSVHPTYRLTHSSFDQAKRPPSTFGVFFQANAVKCSSMLCKLSWLMCGVGSCTGLLYWVRRQPGQPGQPAVRLLEKMLLARKRAWIHQRGASGTRRRVWLLGRRSVRSRQQPRWVLVACENGQQTRQQNLHGASFATPLVDRSHTAHRCHTPLWSSAAR